MFDPPQGLYTSSELLEGFSAVDARGFASTYDFSVFRAFAANGGAVPKNLSIRRAQAEHDCSIGDGLRRFLKAHPLPLVGVMGGHSVKRDQTPYKEMAALARHLTQCKYLIVSGGGPGIMEAAHVGAAFAGSDDTAFQRALEHLGKTAKFPSLDGLLNDDGSIANGMDGKLIEARDWVQAALEARAMISGELPLSLAIPTWLYGAEPTMPFATHYGKYFQNSIREEALINNSRAGIVYGHGGGGTLREVFQDVELNYYAKTPKDFTPMIFYDTEGFWKREAVIKDSHVDRDGIKLDEVIPHILTAARFGMDGDAEKVKACLAKVYFGSEYKVIDQILHDHTQTAQQNLSYALAAKPLRVSTSRLARI